MQADKRFHGFRKVSELPPNAIEVSETIFFTQAKPKPVFTDGEMYHLGSGWGLYNEQYDCFIVGNVFVPRSETKFK